MTTIEKEPVNDARRLAPAPLDAERQLSWMRIGISVVGFAVFPFVEHGPRVHPVLAYALLAIGIVVPVLILRGHAKKKRSALEVNVPWVTSSVDTMITILWIFATGGVDSPWFVALYGSIVAVSLRQHPRESVACAVIGGVGYVLLALSTGQLFDHLAVVTVRVGMMGFLGAGAWAIAHERLRTLSSRLRLLDLTQEVGRIGTWEWSVTNGTLSWSELLYQLFGKDPASFVPSLEGYLDAVHPDDRATVQTTIGDSLANREPFLMNHRVIVGGEVRWLHCRGRVIVDREGRPTEMVGSSQDVTDRRNMEAQLVLSEKFASLGTLASGIAHEINNPLAYVTTNLELLERQMPASSDPTLRDAVLAARHGSARMRDIVRGLKTFSRADQEQLQSVDIARVAEFALDVAGHAIAQRARVKREYENTPAVIANESRLTQVFVNLLVNAAQAIVAGAAEENEICVRIGVEDEGRVVCSISDTGRGIAAEHLPRIFDPFYTTNPGEGTGLGLSICHGIVRDAGGDIAVTSTGPKGTTFTVSLPAASAEARPAEVVEVVETPKPPPSRKRIVVVDDEKRYAESLRLLLGYDHDVALATSAELAIALLADDPAFDVIVCDLMMPGKTGMDLHAALASSSPPLIDRMIFLTGGATTDRAREFLARPDIRHLEKPVELPTLEAMIAEVVERNAAAPR